MLDDRLDESNNPSRVPRVLVGLSAGAALLTTLLVAIAIIRRRSGGSPP